MMHYLLPCVCDCREALDDEDLARVNEACDMVRIGHTTRPPPTPSLMVSCVAHNHIRNASNMMQS